jgi:putative transposase
MKRSRFSEEQIIAVLREAESGTPVRDLCRRAGISAATFYKWKTKYEGMEISEMRRMRLLEDENSRLKKIVAQQALDIDALKVCCQKSGRPAGRTRGRAGCSRRRKAERATRLWADGNEPRKLAVSAERTERCNTAKPTSRVSRGAAALRLSAVVPNAAAREREWESEVGRES